MFIWAAVTLILLLTVPPLGLLSAVAYMYVEYKQEKRNALQVKRAKEATQIGISHPGPCPTCGKEAWSRSPLRMMDAAGIRTFLLPLEGLVSIATFTCKNCRTYGRYARSHAEPERGWVLINWMMGGY